MIDKMSELKPCPVKTCGSINVMYQLDIPYGARVKCLACGASGLETFPIRGNNGHLAVACAERELEPLGSKLNELAYRLDTLIPRTSPLNDGVVYQTRSLGGWSDVSKEIYDVAAIGRNSPQKRILYTSPLASLSDEQWCQLFICMHKVYENSQRLECDDEIAAAGRAWLEGRKI